MFAELADCLVYPFELYCRKCGSKILGRKLGAFEELTNILQNEIAVDSWLSATLRGKQLICPGCGRKVRADPLIRADVFFSDWDDESPADRTIVYYA
jgi:hypothetical protein